MAGHYTLDHSDVGKSHLRAFGQTWRLSDSIGHVQKIDVGKRLYVRGGVLQMENAQQMQARLDATPARNDSIG